MVNTVRKGARNEARAVKELESQGYRCERTKRSRFGSQDFFNCWDIVAVKKGCPTLWVQVKSNRLAKKELDRLQVFVDGFLGLPYSAGLVMVWVDRKGWREVWLTDK